jgi:hypothetical protein
VSASIVVVVGQGVAAALDAEKASLPRGFHPGTFASEPLCAWQREVHARGFRDVELVQSVYGWSVRSGTGLENFALLASSRAGQVDGSYEDALRWATKWCADSPERRYAWRR